jgi:hypothetical protein
MGEGQPKRRIKAEAIISLIVSRDSCICCSYRISVHAMRNPVATGIASVLIL